METFLKKTLIIAPHADDEVLGCGGLIAKYSSSVEFHVALATVGDITFHHAGKVIGAETRKAEFARAMESLGVTSLEVLFEGYESKMDTLPLREIVTKLDNLIRAAQPTAVLIPYPSFHQDHQVVFKAAFAALRPQPHNHVKFVAMFEYPLIAWNYESLNSSMIYINITDTIDRKIEALKCHASQIRPGRHTINPETVALWAEKRGLEVGIQFAEAYRLLKMIV